MATSACCQVPGFFAVRGITLGELAQQVPLVRFALLTLIKVKDARRAGLRLEPTGRNPAPLHTWL